MNNAPIKPYTPAEQALRDMANEYTNFTVAGRHIKIPYVMSSRRWDFWRTSGKSTPEKLNEELIAYAQRYSFDLNAAKEYDVYQFMREHGIGIDCSGLAYHLLDAFVRALHGIPLSQYLVRFPGILGQLEKNLLAFKRSRRINAATLVSPLNAVSVESTKDIRIGDLIFSEHIRDHVLVVTDLFISQHKKLTGLEYIHSSSVQTQKRGPHYGYINVRNPESDIKSQEWLEKTKHGTNYGEEYIKESKRSGIFRLKAIA